jgi:hypothetical protein
MAAIRIRGFIVFCYERRAELDAFARTARQCRADAAQFFGATIP